MPTSTPTLTTLGSFDGSSGSIPKTNLALDAAGNLYGMSSDSNGVLLYGLTNLGTGLYSGIQTMALIGPSGSFSGDFGLVTDAAGNVYGSISVVPDPIEYFFVYQPTVGYLTFLIPDPTDLFTLAGPGPWPALYVNAAGTILTTLKAGGAASDGQIDQITPNTTSTHTYYWDASPVTATASLSFSGTDGKYPNTNLIADAQGNLFGATRYGGASNIGTVFEVAYSAGAYASTPTVLTNFSVATGFAPTGGMTIDASGDLFGFTSGGGSAGHGTIYELAKTGGVYASTASVLVSLPTGLAVNQSLVVDAAGNLFGTTSNGGAFADGTVFEIANGSGVMTTLLSFNGTNGATPLSGLTADAAGNLFGTTYGGGASSLGTVFEVTNSGYVAPIPCFCRGTMIKTPSGEIAVEQLRAGDLVQTWAGLPRRIVWVGMGRTLVTPRNRCDVTPVIVRASALDDGVPSRNLHVTRHHALLVRDVLVPVEHLINGASILWDDRAQVVEYYHIELEVHDILVADGAPAESFRDDGNAHQFQNRASRESRAPMPTCRPVLESGPLLDAIWSHVAARVTGRRAITKGGWTGDTDLHLLVDDQRVDGAQSGEGIWSFDLPNGFGSITIASRTTIPATREGADLRRVGVAVREMTFWRYNLGRSVPLDHANIGDGWHAMAQGHRWTKGMACVPISVADWQVPPNRLEIALVDADLGYRRALQTA